ncbi:Diamine N-acetyltransferase [Leadbetterella byssophila DSM 17132]|uniref:Diamine N-acetyltransferase n=1 Tax=Leadbetterella byssophila (strain DSM 17132 / JCM 16389 / KACC 11308 / NBRC 106382 / 4M15) TaxID=649349 RepID=E4RVI2_LEAB4|nr:GNAT family N-acetyltransferase [Leadbetterella byssophila]ADQ17046.1 Diamine N-acetyltransferase [Leadbetterella byssophila DSM 17132]
MNIRKATIEDVPAIMELVRELAVYEKAPEEVTNTEERMRKEGFGEHPAFECILAEKDGTVVGMSLYYYRYSTWKGRRLYLEDLIVTEKARGTGLGKILLDRTIEIAKEVGCSGMMWQVLDWNTPAIEFYKKYNARLDGEWINCHLDF